MEIFVRYYSKSGNVKKLAEAIAAKLNCDIQSTDIPINDEADLLFICGALYAGNIDKHLRDFIESLDKEKVKRVVIISSSAGRNTIAPKVVEILDRKRIPVSEKVFHCQGKFLFANKGRPNEQDLKDVADFAAEMAK